MLDLLYSWMKNIIIFMIFTTVILNLLGKSNYKKYVGLVTGLLLVLLVITPLLKLTDSKEYMDFSLDSYGSLASAEDLSYELFAMEEQSNVDILKQYREVLYAQTERLLNEKGLTIEKIYFEIPNDKSSKEFGTIKRISLTASYSNPTEEEKNDGTADPIVPVAPVTVGQIVIKEEEVKEETEAKKNLSAMEIHIKNILADFYNLETNNINITIREDHDGERG